MGGSVLAGIRTAVASPYLLGVCAWLLCYTLLSTTLYFQQIEIVGREIADPAERTRLFSTVDLVVNSLTLLTQILLFPRLVAGLGVGWLLALMPLLAVGGFLALGAAPTLAVLVVFGVARRAGEFAISKPARETLFTVVPREEKYKAKNFIDTVVYRGGDTAAGWIFGATALLRPVTVFDRVRDGAGGARLDRGEPVSRPQARQPARGRTLECADGSHPAARYCRPSQASRRSHW